MGTPWNQPTLGGPSVAWFGFSSEFRWPLGWRGSLSARMEGEDHPTTIFTFSELTSDQLRVQLDLIASYLEALVLGD